MWRLTPFTSWLLFLCRRLCGRHGPSSCPPRLLCLRPSRAHRMGSRPPTCVTCRARTPGEGARGCALYRGSSGEGEPAHRPDARSPRRLRRPASSDPGRLPPALLSADHAPPPQPPTPRSAAPPRCTRPTDSCKGFLLLVAVAACRQLVLNFDPNSFLILEYF